MAPGLDLPRALLRGRYMAAAARMEWNGVPIDVADATRLPLGWEEIKTALIAEIDVDYGVYEGTTFKLDRFERYLVREGIPWPRLPSGQLDLADDTFRERARSEPLHRALPRAAQLALADAARRPHGWAGRS